MIAGLVWCPGDTVLKPAIKVSCAWILHQKQLLLVSLQYATLLPVCSDAIILCLPGIARLSTLQQQQCVCCRTCCMFSACHPWIGLFSATCTVLQTMLYAPCCMRCIAWAVCVMLYAFDTLSVSYLDRTFYWNLACRIAEFGGTHIRCCCDTTILAGCHCGCFLRHMTCSFRVSSMNHCGSRSMHCHTTYMLLLLLHLVNCGWDSVWSWSYHTWPSPWNFCTTAGLAWCPGDALLKATIKVSYAWILHTTLLLLMSLKYPALLSVCCNAMILCLPGVAPPATLQQQQCVCLYVFHVLSMPYLDRTLLCNLYIAASHAVCSALHELCVWSCMHLMWYLDKDFSVPCLCCCKQCSICCISGAVRVLLYTIGTFSRYLDRTFCCSLACKTAEFDVTHICCSESSILNCYHALFLRLDLELAPLIVCATLYAVDALRTSYLDEPSQRFKTWVGDALLKATVRVSSAWNLHVRRLLDNALQCNFYVF